MRPKSIIRFEQLFFLGIALALILSALTWNARMEIYHQTPAAEMLGDAFPVITLAIGYAIWLLLWYFIARRASSIAKWIYVVLFVLAVIAVMASLTFGQVIDTTALAGQVIGVLIQAASIWFLFQPDANAWFSGDAAPAQDFRSPIE